MTTENRQQRIDALFAQAVSLPVSEQAAFLDRASANDPPEIRAEVDKLLAMDEKARKDSNFLGEPPLHDVAAEVKRMADEAEKQNGSAANIDVRSRCSQTDRNLLFGIVALQFDFVTRDELIAAMHAWMLTKHRAIGEILVDEGALESDDRRMLEAMVDRHVQLHDNNPEKSLAGLSSIGSMRDELQSLKDNDVERSLASVSASRRDDPDRTADRSYGEWTSEGGRFRILRPYAKGGLGDVSVAMDTELNREVALKRIQDWHADDPNSRGRFVLEAEVTGGLEHPGIVPVYGLGQDHSQRPFYAMRFVKGRSLYDAIRSFHDANKTKRDPSERIMEFRELLGRFVDVCNSVAFAHSRGVLHRDLKPGNIMLGKYGETLVVDWGLAKVVGRRGLTDLPSEATLHPKSGSDSAPTLEGRAVGTPVYMSPEQAEGRLDQLGPATDVYSLGATLYVLLTGKQPFTGTHDEVLLRVQRGEFPRPRNVMSKVPRALEAVCLRAMQHDPACRYESASALAQDIERWLADEPVASYRESIFKRTSRRLGFHRRPHFFALTIVLLVADFLMLSAMFCALLLPAGHFATTAIWGAMVLWTVGEIVFAQAGAFAGALVGLACGYGVRILGFGSSATVRKCVKRLAWTGGIVASLLPLFFVLFGVLMAGVSIFTPATWLPTEMENAAEAYNHLAWIQLTGSPEVRDGAEAVENARNACELVGDNYAYLDTLAAAYAETGDFQLAIETQQKAIDLAASQWEVEENARELRDLARRLECYKSKQPWRNGR